MFLPSTEYDLFHSEKPYLIFFVGSAGTGKTTLAKEVVKEMNGIFLDRDTVAGRYSNHLLTLLHQDPLDRDSQFYLTHCRDIEYAITMDVALENLSLGKNVILVSPFTKELKDPHWIHHQLSEIGHSIDSIHVRVIHLYISDLEKQKERIIHRGDVRDQWKLENWEEYKKRVKGLADFEMNWGERIPVLHLDNSEEELKDVVDEVMFFIEVGTIRAFLEEIIEKAFEKAEKNQDAE